MIPSIIVSIIFLSLILIKSADMVVVAIRRLSRQTHTRAFAISAIILALGTSFPELFVGITSALEKTPVLSLGDVTGSNITNIALVGGLTALVAGRVRVYGEYLRRNVWMALVAGMLPAVLLFDKQLSRVDGLILITVYLATLQVFLERGSSKSAKNSRKKVLFIVIILVCGTAGYLYYDWHIHTKKMAAEPSITLYSWTDEEGAKHFTDTPPPKGARDVETSKGSKYVEPPLVVQIKDNTVEFYKWIKKKIFKKKKNKERQ